MLNIFRIKFLAPLPGISNFAKSLGLFLFHLFHFVSDFVVVSDLFLFLVFLGTSA